MAEHQTGNLQKEIGEAASATRTDDALAGVMTFNMEQGYLEAYLRGLKLGFLSKFEYRQLVAVESIDDFKTVLSDTDYCAALQTLATVRAPAIHEKCVTKFVNEFEFLRTQAMGQLGAFMDLISYDYLIRNVVEMIGATVKGTPGEEALDHAHPLGRSPYLKAISTFEKDDNILDLYKIVLVDMPVAKYFAEYFDDAVKSGEPAKVLQGAFKDMDTQIIYDHVRKVWLEDFYNYCRTLGGETWTMMAELLEFEADRRAIEIVYNSIAMKSNLNDGVNRASRQELFCTFGKLYPECTSSLPQQAAAPMSHFSRVDSIASLTNALEKYPVYREAIKKSNDKQMSLSDALKNVEIAMLKQAFDGQSQFSAYYAFVKLKMVELENILSLLQGVSGRGRRRGDDDEKGDKAPKYVAKYIPIF